MKFWQFLDTMSCLLIDKFMTEDKSINPYRKYIYPLRLVESYIPLKCDRQFRQSAPVSILQDDLIFRS